MNKLQKLKRYLFRFLPLMKLVFFLSAVGLIIFSFYLAFPFFWKMGSNIFALPRTALVFFKPEKTSLKTTQGRLNFLLLGIGGGGHISPDLTDTMFFTSFDLQNADLVMLAIPRDIWLEDLETKINATYHYGEEKEAGGGLILGKSGVEKVTGQIIHYAILIDFEGFKKAIDLLGGIKVFVDQSFDDFKYPVPGKENEECEDGEGYRCRYQYLHFDSGWQIMNGETALQFVRSRNAEGEEGTDFARSQRQQKIILAFRNKLFSPKILLSPKKIKQLKKIAEEHIKTDLPLNLDSFATLAGSFLKFSLAKKPIRTLSLETGDEENPQFLINPPSWQYGQWVLRPRTGDWQEIHQYLQSKIEGAY